MNFFMIQSLGTYTKNMEMQMKWQQKKANNDFTADGSTKLNDPIARQAEEIRMAQADESSKISSQIRTKLANGKKLTREEMDYLQKNDPQTYQKAKAIEEEQKSYEEELKRCKTKEDVQRVKMNRTAASLSVVNSVKNNPAIPEGAKLGIIMQELMKNKALEETISAFVKSGRYAQLPTEAEKMEAEKAIEEAKAAESGTGEPKSAEPGTDEPKSAESETDEPKAAEFRSENSTAGIKETSSGKSEKNEAHKTEDISDDAAKDALIHESAQKNRALLQERRKTLAEAERTPEALKVKRARVRAAYRASQSRLPEQLIDLKK